jgi:regulatory protein
MAFVPEEHRAVSSFDPAPARPARKRRRRQTGEGGAPRMKTFDKLVQLCSVRERSSAELAQRLTGYGYSDADAQEAIAKAQRLGIVDDARFTELFIRTRLASGRGERSIERDLLKHGIVARDLEGWPEAYGIQDDSQMEAALDLLRSHPPRAKDAWGAAYRKLTNRGFQPGVVSRAVRQWYDARESEDCTDNVAS